MAHYAQIAARYYESGVDYENANDFERASIAYGWADYYWSLADY